MTTELIRNFSIIAHIDHGKSTLADRLLQMTGTLSGKEMREQVLDDMELERERGITIKAHAVRMEYSAIDGKAYVLNLIDTPGHVDFSYEVSRSLAACEGALLVVDAVQGMEAQTISNLYLALENDLIIIPVVNKIDLQNARTDRVKGQLADLLGVSQDEVLCVSAKLGWGIAEILEAIVERISPPGGSDKNRLKALIFDSVFDRYRGAVVYVRMFDGSVNQGDHVRLFSNGKVYQVEEVGVLRLKKIKTGSLSAGEVGYLICGIKELADAKVGDTILEAVDLDADPLPGYKDVKPMVFSGLYPQDPDDYEELRDFLERLKLNDSSLSYVPETSNALGFGFRCGFLGLLHMEIVGERLEREYGLKIITTVPNVEYRVILKDGTKLLVDNPADMPPQGEIDAVEEPILEAQILTPRDYMGNIMKLVLDRRGVYVNTEYLEPTRVVLKYEIPLAEVVFDFYDRLKSVSRGYASFDYEYKEHSPANLVKLDILINSDSVDALSAIIHRDKAYNWGRQLCKRLKELIPKQLFGVVIQGAVGNKVISREVIRPFKKNVTAKCYGGDITRKRKLLERQREGKKRMKQVGNVEIPQEAFLAILNVGE